MTWTPGQISGVEALEVYPVATLVGRGWVTTGYKKSKEEGYHARQLLVRSLRAELEMEEGHAAALALSDDLIDAAVCVLAACDFAHGDVSEPSVSDREASRREGWIWVRARSAP